MMSETSLVAFILFLLAAGFGILFLIVRFIYRKFMLPGIVKAVKKELEQG